MSSRIRPMAHQDLHSLCLPHVTKVVSPPARVLDLGAGSGSMSQLLLEAGYQVSACDLDASLFECTDVECREADLSQTLPYEDSSFEAIVCLEVLEHMDGHERVFREVERLLVPGAPFVFSTPNVMSIKSRVSFLWTGFKHSFYPMEPGEHTPQGWHLSGYGANRYRFVMSLAGLELREISYDKLSSTSVALAGLAPLIRLRTWLRHGKARGAELNNCWAALFGRSLVGIAYKPESTSQCAMKSAAA